MKMILIFDSKGELIKSVRYNSKREAKGNYSIFKKHGYLDSRTGEKIIGCTFEII